MTTPDRLGVLLAGGRGARLGGVDKGGVIVNGKSLGERAAERLGAQVSQFVIVGAERSGWCLATGAKALIDDIKVGGSSIGPAGGLLSALHYAAKQVSEDVDIFTAPIDCPLFPLDLADQLMRGRGEASAAIASNTNGLHPVFGLFNARLAAAIHELVIGDQVRALRAIAQRTNAVAVDIDASSDAFFNVNTPDDLETAQKLLATQD